MLSLSHSKIVLTLLVSFSLSPIVYASNNNRALVTSKRGRRNKWHKVNPSTSNAQEEAAKTAITPAQKAKNNAAAGLLAWRKLDALIKSTEGEIQYSESHIQRIKAEAAKRTAAIQQKLDERTRKLTAQKDQIAQDAQTQIAGIQATISQRQNITQEAFARRMGLLATLASDERILLKHNSQDQQLADQQLATELDTILSNSENTKILTLANITRTTQNILAESAQTNNQETPAPDSTLQGLVMRVTEPTPDTSTIPAAPAPQEVQGWVAWMYEGVFGPNTPAQTPAPAPQPATTA